MSARLFEHGVTVMSWKQKITDKNGSYYTMMLLYVLSEYSVVIGIYWSIFRIPFVTKIVASIDKMSFQN
jgi:hypothetical protein